jgi:hypothetical protein
MRQIEAEFGEPIRDIIYVMRHSQRQPLGVIAGALGIQLSTLRRWLGWLDIPPLEGPRPYYRSGPFRDRCLREWGAEPGEVITGLRLLGYRYADITALLGCGHATVSGYLPAHIKDGRYMLSAAGREVKRRSAAIGRSYVHRHCHPWRATSRKTCTNLKVGGSKPLDKSYLI